jgi:hypothetical protein
VLSNSIIHAQVKTSVLPTGEELNRSGQRSVDDAIGQNRTASVRDELGERGIKTVRDPSERQKSQPPKAEQGTGRSGRMEGRKSTSDGKTAVASRTRLDGDRESADSD